MDDKDYDRPDARAGGEGDAPDARAGPRYGGSQPRTAAAMMNESDFVANRYKMDYEKRGTAVIINNKDFHARTGMGVRTGTDVDADNVYNLLDDLGFEKIIRKDNQSVDQMINLLKQESKKDHRDSDCFMCFILSHGEEGYVFGTDDKIELDKLVTFFKGHNCQSLAGKPKLFFIQACRGTELDQGVEVADALGEEEMEEEIILRSIPTEADFLMAFSVVPGFFAWRNSARGSWFIQALVEVFSQNWRTMDVLTMLTRVNKKVAYDFQSNASKEYMNRKKQIPCITSMLTKDVFFTPK